MFGVPGTYETALRLKWSTFRFQLPAVSSAKGTTEVECLGLRSLDLSLRLQRCALDLGLPNSCGLADGCKLGLLVPGLGLMVPGLVAMGSVDVLETLSLACSMCPELSIPNSWTFEPLAALTASCSWL